MKTFPANKNSWDQKYEDPFPSPNLLVKQVMKSKVKLPDHLTGLIQPFQL